MKTIKMLTVLCAALLLWLCALPALAVEGAFIEDKTYGGPGDDWAVSIFYGSPFSLGGTSYPELGLYPDYGDMYLVRTGYPYLGPAPWAYTYGTDWGGWPGSEEANSAIGTTNAGKVLAGWTDSTSSGHKDMYLVKTNYAGVKQWSNTYGDYYDEVANSVIRTSDGGYLLAGTNGQVYMVKTNPNGVEQWTKTHALGSMGSQANSVIKCSDNSGYVLAGYYNYHPTFRPVMLVVKTDLNGDITPNGWVRTADWWPDPSYYAKIAHAVIETSDGGYLVAGVGTPQTIPVPSDQMYLIKLAANGDFMWGNHYGGTGTEYAKSVIKTCGTTSTPAGYLLAGYTNSVGVGGDAYLVKTNASGVQQWENHYGGSGYECANQVMRYGAYYVMAGVTQPAPTDDKDMYAVRVEGLQCPITVAPVPMNPPILIPRTGGFFQFNLQVANADSLSPHQTTCWTDITLPSEAIYGPIIGPLNLSIPAGGSLSRLRTQVVPGSAAAGNYTYNAYLGEYPGTVVEHASFPFTKLEDSLSADGGAGVADWFSTGELFPGEDRSSKAVMPEDVLNAAPLPATLELHRAFPNPFNPTTAISFQLPAFSHVSLKVYNTAGRLVADLVNGWREAGSHEVTFDGSNLASGIYLARLQAGNFAQIQKLVLMK